MTQEFKPGEWVEASKAAHDKKYLVVGQNSYGKYVRTLARYLPPEYEEDFNSDFAVYSAEKDSYFLPEGWYECPYEPDEFCALSFTPTHIMVLPNPPEGGQ